MLTSSRPGRCKHCKVRFEPEDARKRLHPECVDPWMAAFKEKQARKAIKERVAQKRIEKAETKARKERIKTHAEWKADAQKAVNDFVRLRDAHLPCISCGRFHEGAWHAGHFRSRGAAPQLALDPRNVHRQCAPCNLFLHGNQIAYRAGLVARYGADYVAALESENEPLKLTVEELKQIKVIHKGLARDLRKANA